MSNNNGHQILQPSYGVNFCPNCGFAHAEFAMFMRLHTHMSSTVKKPAKLVKSAAAPTKVELETELVRRMRAPAKRTLTTESQRDKIREHHKAKMPVKQIAKTMGLKPSTIGYVLYGQLKNRLATA